MYIETLFQFFFVFCPLERELEAEDISNPAHMDSEHLQFCTWTGMGKQNSILRVRKEIQG